MEKKSYSFLDDEQLIELIEKSHESQYPELFIEYQKRVDFYTNIKTNEKKDYLLVGLVIVLFLIFLFYRLQIPSPYDSLTFGFLNILGYWAGTQLGLGIGLKHKKEFWKYYADNKFFVKRE